MKTIKVAVLALFLPMLVLAQNKKDMKEKSHMRIEKTASKQTDWMKKNLNLNSDQLEDVEEINRKYVEKREEVFMENDTKEEKWEELEENWNEQTRELKDVLNEGQFAKLEIEKQKWFDETKSRWNNDRKYEKDDGKKEENNGKDY